MKRQARSGEDKVERQVQREDQVQRLEPHSQGCHGEAERENRKAREQIVWRKAVGDE